MMIFNINEKNYFTGLFKSFNSMGVIQQKLSSTDNTYLDLDSEQPFNFKLIDINNNTDVSISLIGTLLSPVA